LNFTQDQFSDDTHLYSGYFDLGVNRAFGSTANKTQWVQDPDSVMITGLYVHCLPVTKLYAPGFVGWWITADTMYDHIKFHKILHGKAVTGTSQGVRIPTPGPHQSSSQPPVKKARLTPREDSDTSTDESDYEDLPDLEDATESLSKISLADPPVTMETDDSVPPPKIEISLEALIPQSIEPAASSAPAATTENFQWSRESAQYLSCTDPLCGKDKWPDDTKHPFCAKCTASWNDWYSKESEQTQ
jgi:hypothetical protein